MFDKIIRKKEHFVSICIIALFVLLEIFLITKNGETFVSRVDYYKQSVAFADYFRNLFYETGKLFPSFAPHIGAGQNIYYFAYYGLFSPITLFSYLLPFVNMLDYIQIAMISNLIVSGILMYVWLLKNNFKKNSSLIGALLFVSSCSFLFNSSRHIMFVDYMSFFLLSLIGVKIYREKGKSFFLILGTFLTIMTSYYFSIPCILCLFLYDLYLNMESKNHTFKQIFIKELDVFLRILIAILLSSFFLFPIFYTLLSRTKTAADINILSSFTFSIQSDYLFYSQKGIGLNTIVLITLLFHLIVLNKGNRVVAIIIFLIMGIPFFSYAFNGFMYQEAKVFIPFLPIIVFLTVNMLENIDKFCLKKILIFLFLFSIFSLFFIELDVKVKVFTQNFMVNMIVLFLYKNSTKFYKTLYLLPIVFFCSKFTIEHYWNREDKQVSKEQYAVYENTLVNGAEKFMDEDTIYRYQNMDDEYINLSNAKGLYLPTVYSSISNPYYAKVFNRNFYNNFTSRNFLFFTSLPNPFYLHFMGIKYNNAEEQIYGYEKLTDDNLKNLYINKNVFPIGYFRNNLLNEYEYEELSSIEKLQAYQNNIIIEGKSNNPNLEFVQEEIFFDLDEILAKNFIYTKESGHFTFDTKEKNFIYQFKNPLENATLIIQFKVNNNPLCEQEEIIKINGIRNILTCDAYTYHNGNHTFNYVIQNSVLEKLNIEITEGFYDISDLKVYRIDNTFFDNIPEVAFEFDKEKTKGDIIEGYILAPSDGYVLFTIPYDKGFNLYIDGKKEKAELVNEGFIGFKVKAGKHHIKIQYIAPFSQIGKCISLLGIVCFFTLIFYEGKKSK